MRNVLTWSLPLAVLSVTPSPDRSVSQLAKEAQITAVRRSSIPRTGRHAAHADDAGSQRRILEAYDKLPMAFEANRGQTDRRVTDPPRFGGQIGNIS
jgi:hypothetical protein